MNYVTIKCPPPDNTSYAVTTLKNVIAALREGKSRVVALGIIGAFSDAVEFANANGYHVSFMRCTDPSDPGGIMSMIGTFYFRRDG